MKIKNRNNKRPSKSLRNIPSVDINKLERIEVKSDKSCIAYGYADNLQTVFLVKSIIEEVEDEPATGFISLNQTLMENGKKKLYRITSINDDIMNLETKEEILDRIYKDVYDAR